MSASKAEYFRPPWAVTAWADDQAVYVELPMSPTPYIQRFPLTEAGLSKALHVLCEAKREAPIKYASSVYRFPEPKITKLSPRRSAKMKSTEAQREAARLVLKKLGMLP